MVIKGKLYHLEHKLHINFNKVVRAVTVPANVLVGVGAMQVTPMVGAIVVLGTVVWSEWRAR